jgi:hypothetical protein
MNIFSSETGVVFDHYRCWKRLISVCEEISGLIICILLPVYYCLYTIYCVLLYQHPSIINEMQY